MIKNKNLVSINLVEIKDKHPELKKVFLFLDQLTLNLINNSCKPSFNTVIFINYMDNKKYHVSLKFINEFLPECFYNFYFKTILSKLVFISNFRTFRRQKWFALFFKSLFFTIKNGIKRNIVIDKDFLFVSIKNLSKLENEEDISSFDDYIFNIINNFDLQYLINAFKNYLVISSETFSFSNSNRFNNRSYNRYNQYFELINLLKQKNISILSKIDISLQLIVLISFKNVKYNFNNKNYIDNSYILKLFNSSKNLPEIEKKCQRFNNL